MKKSLSILVFILLAAAVALVLIFNNDKSDYRIVKFSGAEMYSGGLASEYLNVVTANEEGIAALPLFDDELIIMTHGDTELYYLYQFEDGIDLNLKFDGFKIFINDKLAHLEIENSDEAIHFLETIEAEDVKDLKSIYILDSLTDQHIEHLDRLAELKPELGIIFDSDSPSLDYVLTRFDPIWLMCYYEESLNPDSIEELLKDSKNLELLYVDAEFLDFVDISGLNQLKQLLISDINSEEQMSGFVFPENLENLSLIGAKIDDLSFLAELKELKSLSLSFHNYFKISPELNDLKNLESLKFSDNNYITGFELLGEFPALRRIAFPRNVKQEVFSTFLSVNDHLEIVELLECDSITDLTPLTKLSKLRCLNVIESNFPFEAFSDFKGLKYLGVSYDPESDKEEIDNLKSDLPDTLIVPTSGLCLGSGWLLAIIPVLLILLVFLFIRKRRTANN